MGSGNIHVERVPKHQMQLKHPYEFQFVHCRSTCGCRDIKSHFILTMHVPYTCRCGSKFRNNGGYYIWCKEKNLIYFVYYPNVILSVHSKCNDPIFMELYSLLTLNEILALFHKLRIIQKYLTHDIIRHTIISFLRQLSRNLIQKKYKFIIENHPRPQADHKQFLFVYSQVSIIISVHQVRKFRLI